MSFYLGVWNSETAISDDEAAARYLVVAAEKSAEPEFDPRVYAFYCRLTSLYPEVEMVSEDELGSCPWASGLDVAGDHVIMAIQPEQSEKILPEVLALAAQHALVCFDPQAGKVHLPPHLRAPQAIADSAGDSRSQLSAIQPNGEPEMGGDALKSRPSCHVVSKQ
jgi:hypothetical protein